MSSRFEVGYEVARYDAADPSEADQLDAVEVVEVRLEGPGARPGNGGAHEAYPDQ
jgi:hypothetical protein